LATNDGTPVWLPDRSGSYSTQCERGRSYASALMATICDDDLTPRFGAVLRAMVEGGEWGAVEIGFAQQIAEFAQMGWAEQSLAA
jgi:hypothetical protein